ncbi:hypothetical protein OV090_34460 [Nannocystis sp. RBIL2]|uniref:hypothetical protein n=1 Tax=Nannocystis sp. RBIL2 TaxID=2996788 RepID=UPI00226FCF23|nr:hypothetical protein [Nannocystis sp. RBIL2]MCY1069896.1 hypothetical protein [Nannocystis sp. RBIL2]
MKVRIRYWGWVLGSSLAAMLVACGGKDGEEAAMAACAAAGSEAACEAIRDSSYFCAWVRSVVVTGDCETVDEPVCVAVVERPAPPACLPIRGCLGSQPGQPGKLSAPGFREEEPGVTRLVDVCFSAVLGYDPCESGVAADAADPACACVCDSAP